MKTEKLEFFFFFLSVFVRRRMVELVSAFYDLWWARSSVNDLGITAISTDGFEIL